MDLDPYGREFYGFTPTTSPAVDGPWEAMFDTADGWVPGEDDPDNSGGYRWLVAGHLADPTHAVAVITRTMTPRVRAVDSPEIIVRRSEVPPINYKA